MPLPPIDWDDVAARADAAWHDGAGRAVDAAVLGHEDAARAVPIGPTGVLVQSQFGLYDQDQWVGAVELPLGLGGAARRAWRAAGDAARADGIVDRDAYVRVALDAWARYWLSSRLAEDLTRHLAAIDADLDRLDDASTAGALSALALDDLRAESAWLRGEVWGYRVDAERAAAELRVAVGPFEAPVATVEPPDVEVANPWRSSGDGPAAAAARAHAAAEDARRTSLRPRPTLEIGPMVARDAQGALRTFGYGGLRVPFGTSDAPERVAARGLAEAARAEADVAAARHQAAMDAEAALWDLEVERLARLRADVVGPMNDRLARTEAAYREGLVTVDRLLRVRRETHEAEHEVWVLVADLLARRARAHWTAALAAEGATP